MAPGRISIGFATVATLTVDMTPYFDTPQDVGSRNGGKSNPGHYCMTQHGDFAVTGSNDIDNPMTYAQRKAVYTGLINDSRGGATSGPTNLKGFVRRFHWRQLQQGATKATAVNDFSQIAEDMQFLSPLGFHYIIMIETRAYDNSGIVDGTGHAICPSPDYIKNSVDHTGGQNAPAVLVTSPGTLSAGIATCLYQPFVWDAFNDLLTALANFSFSIGSSTSTLNSFANFEGYMTQETAIGIPQGQLNGDNAYFINGVSGTPILADMHAGTKNQVSVVPGNGTIMPRDGFAIHIQNVFNLCKVFWVMNFLAGQESQKGNCAKAIQANGPACMGGPDDQPDTANFSKPLYGEYLVMNNNYDLPLPTMINMSSPSYTMAHTDHTPFDSYYAGHGISDWTGTGRNWTSEEIFLFNIRIPQDRTNAGYAATPGLGITYMFWSTNGRWNTTLGSGSNSAVGVIQKYPTFN